MSSQSGEHPAQLACDSRHTVIPPMEDELRLPLIATRCITFFLPLELEEVFCESPETLRTDTLPRYNEAKCTLSTQHSRKPLFGALSDSVQLVPFR